MLSHLRGKFRLNMLSNKHLVTQTGLRCLQKVLPIRCRAYAWQQLATEFVAPLGSLSGLVLPLQTTCKITRLTRKAPARKRYSTGRNLRRWFFFWPIILEDAWPLSSHQPSYVWKHENPHHPTPYNLHSTIYDNYIICVSTLTYDM